MAGLSKWRRCSYPRDGSQRTTLLKGLQSIVPHALDTHCGLRYFCPLCLGWQFKSERSKNRHCRHCPGQGLDPVTCAYCMLQWENQYDFALHVPQCAGPSKTKVKTPSRRRTSGTI
jgi:hypothetical protein